MRAMNRIVIMGAVALAGGAAAKPQPAELEALAQCGKLGVAWIKQHPLPESDGEDTFSAGTFYSPKTNQCWIIKTGIWGISKDRERHLIDAQTGAETMTCFDTHSDDASAQPKHDCKYIDNVESGDLASGFMPVPLPPKDQASAK